MQWLGKRHDIWFLLSALLLLLNFVRWVSCDYVLLTLGNRKEVIRMGHSVELHILKAHLRFTQNMHMDMDGAVQAYPVFISCVFWCVSFKLADVTQPMEQYD